ncbi:hypothetical protein FC82_GL001604 [Secundilactobacillus collinoides DSM 20515 = JCM 1123]|uniref:Uncharacterized protein n=1 Tax=Secundilactobacillus collinoides DSM 20515 = JCM 1123 TaxID=1423733 RepID=A0A0R2BC57_SECCO|nr:hypothetical protein FC82_GL001604 [Secundilactobacillus collinoides DSM 20515 = JCM 1123]
MKEPLALRNAFSHGCQEQAVKNQKVKTKNQESQNSDKKPKTKKVPPTPNVAGTF